MTSRVWGVVCGWGARRLKSPRRGLVCWVMGVLIACVIGCGAEGERRERVASDEPRVVSLAPAVTRMIVDLGRAGVVVGVSDHDVMVGDDVPRVGGFDRLDVERVLSLRPTHVVTMGSGSVPPRLAELGRRHGFEVVVYPYPTTVERVGEVLVGGEDRGGGPDASSRTPQRRRGEGGTPSVGQVVGREREAAALWRSVDAGLAALRAVGDQNVVVKGHRPRVLLAFGVEPVVSASGPGTINDELLRLAGGENVLAGMKASYVTLDREQLLALRPEVVMVLRPGEARGGTRGGPDASSRTPRRRREGWGALEGLDARVVVLDDPAVLLPGTNIAETAAAMQGAIWAEEAEANGDAAGVSR